MIERDCTSIGRSDWQTLTPMWRSLGRRADSGTGRSSGYVHGRARPILLGRLKARCYPSRSADMSRDPGSTDFSSLFRIDVSATPAPNLPPQSQGDAGPVMVELLRQLAAGQERQNQLLEELLNHFQASQKQRARELGQWKEANPELARACRTAASALTHVQNRFLDGLTQEVTSNSDGLQDSDYMLQEFVDRFGPRLAHLNCVLQVLNQLGATAPASGAWE